MDPPTIPHLELCSKQAAQTPIDFASVVGNLGYCPTADPRQETQKQGTRVGILSCLPGTHLDIRSRRIGPRWM